MIESVAITLRLGTLAVWIIVRIGKIDMLRSSDDDINLLTYLTLLHLSILSSAGKENDEVFLIILRIEKYNWYWC